MLFALVAVSLSTSFGSITPEAHPSTRLLAQADLAVPPNTTVALAELEHQLDVELHKTSPFIVPGVLFGAAALSAIVGTIFVFVPIGWSALLVISIAYLAAVVFVAVAIGTVIAAGVVQARRNQRVKELREEIARLKSLAPQRELVPPPPPPAVQNLPTVGPQVVLATF